ncbi:MAG: hypothetical protein OEZ68_00610 [Gammaproteobacteria bacterium]|nr:hypothetical protein [Gammaproteobacteria bacterium]MDH5799279.1 hypothetical protein [Gammaproteobacteria bacterium]
MKNNGSKQKILFLVSILFSGFAYADPWSGWTKINTMYPHNGGLNILIGYANPNFSSCDNGTRYNLSITHPNYKVMAANIMSAYALGKEININIHGHNIDTPVCAPTFNRLMIR